MRKLACPHTRSGPTHIDLLLAIAHMYGEVKEPLCLLTVCLGIPADSIHISETSTNTVANASATAALASSDLYVRNGCQGGV